MSEFDRLVAVNSVNDLPGDVLNKLFKSSSATSFKSNIISDSKILSDKGDQLLQSELTSKISTIEKSAAGKLDNPGPGSKDRFISHDGTKTVWADNPAKVLKEGVDGQVLGYDGYKATWVAPKSDIPPGGATGQVLSIDEFGDAKWVNPFFNRTAKLDKDILAKAQGFIIVNSTEQPEQVNYTTEDGVTVPVIWHQPTESVIPTVPTRPYFYPDAPSIGIPSSVGFDYYLLSYEKNGTTKTIKRKLIPGENNLSDVAALPFKARFGVKPRPGYKIPATFEWSMIYYDVESDAIFGADNFTERPENSLIFNTRFGQTNSYWMIPQAYAMQFPISTNHPEYADFISEAPQKAGWFRIKNKALKLHHNTGWSNIGFKTASRNMTVVMDFEKIDSRPSSLSINMGTDKSLVNGLWVNFNAEGFWISTPDRKQYKYSNEPGKYRFSLIQNRFEVKFPDGSIHTDMLDIPFESTSYGPYFGIRLNNRSTDPNFYTAIRSLTVRNHGV